MQVMKSRQDLRLIKILLLIFNISACADVYEWQDKDGNKHFSDRVHDNSKKIDLNPGYSYYKVEQVYDGDTVKLSDGRKIRLLDINTPEVKHRNQDAEAGGEIAKQWLTNKLKDQKVRLMTDVEQTDKYKRTLAYLITENKENINVQLVELGLAAVNIYPPNLLYVDELVAAGNRAQQAKRGIWQQAQYTVIPVDQLGNDGHSGWTRLKGKVSNIRSSRKFVYLDFSDVFQARIEKQWLSLFPEINSYRGRTIEVRGWLNKNRGGWSMLIRHPSAIHGISD
ncbi:micrococcal nuclease-like nuclease [Methyloglobulus morosus KoM1]|uniref:Micrococcal nuclease-like nuclease n=2 Tax=Methyloglobulus TaxID=1410680 RepID=V5C8S3_9GAMM|nr:micrococcal nuclease-like nuclease [Methyloglobulus morosus KoM1]